ncbi:MAG: signal peptidase I [Crocinitomicaceae bacterium]|nr:signal peptidase I [Crocinitomicaceae bacterium]
MNRYLRPIFAVILILAFVRQVSAQETDDSCIVRERRTIQGKSMEPLLKNGQKVFLMHNYYQCGNTVQKGDIVAFHNGAEKIPLIKVVCATPADSLQLSNGYLTVNGDTLTNSAGEVYHFSDGQSKMLKMYIGTGHIPKGSLMVFGDNVRVSTDSRIFGVSSEKDLIGKFDLVYPEKK